jgi:hypothetical protein
MSRALDRSSPCAKPVFPEKWSGGRIRSRLSEGAPALAIRFERHSSRVLANSTDRNRCSSTTSAVLASVRAIGDFHTQFGNTTDGVMDLFWITAAGSTRMMSTWPGDGTGNFGQYCTLTDNNLALYTPLFDINGDGKTDVLWYSTDGFGLSTGHRALWLSKGDGTFISQYNAGGLDGTVSGYRRYVVDFNGDGLTDIVWLAAADGDQHLCRGSAPVIRVARPSRRFASARTPSEAALGGSPRHVL